MVSSRIVYFPLCLAEVVNKQECIPVGCVPSAAVAVGGGRCVSQHALCRGVSATTLRAVKNHQKSHCGQIDATLVSRSKTFTLDKNENILFYRHSSSKVTLLMSFSTCNWKNLTANRK